jgi:hypothetical protein
VSVVAAVAAVKTYEQTAVEFAALTVSVTCGHSVVEPSAKVTLPVGSTFVAAPVGGVTVAVRVAVWFTAGEVGEDTNPVWAATFVTVSVIVGAVASLKFVSVP